MSTRTEKLGDLIRDELARLLLRDLRDPRLGFVTITGVELSRDKSHAKVFFTVLGEEGLQDETLEGLQRAAGFLRSALAHRLTTRTVPELHFAYDESIERGVRLSRLIDDAVNPPPAAPAPRRPRAKK